MHANHNCQCEFSNQSIKRTVVESFIVIPRESFRSLSIAPGSGPNAATNSNEAYHTPTSTNTNEGVISSTADYSYINSNEVYSAINDITTNSNEAYFLVMSSESQKIPTTNNEVTSTEVTQYITTDGNEAYGALSGTESDINSSYNEAYGAVTSYGGRESGHVTTHSNDAYCATRRT